MRGYGFITTYDKTKTVIQTPKAKTAVKMNGHAVHLKPAPDMPPRGDCPFCWQGRLVRTKDGTSIFCTGYDSCGSIMPAEFP